MNNKFFLTAVFAVFICGALDAQHSGGQGNPFAPGAQSQAPAGKTQDSAAGAKTADNAKIADGPKSLAFAFDIVPLAKGFIASESKDEEYYTYKDNTIALNAYIEKRIAARYSALFSAGYAGRTVEMRPQQGSNSKTSATFLCAAAHGRWYPFSDAMDGLFIDFALGVSNLSVKDRNNSDADKLGFTGLTTALKAGGRLPLGGIILEPSISYELGKSDPSLMQTTPLGWQIGFGIGFAL